MLVAPAHDSVLRTPTGRIALSADATDDFGLAIAAFEYIISSGEGETFKFASGTLGAREAERDATRRSAASISIDSLALKPGDIVHLRAVARDANDVIGARRRRLGDARDSHRAAGRIRFRGRRRRRAGRRREGRASVSEC